MEKKHYENPELRLIPMSFVEVICGSVPDYDVIDDYEWEDED